MITHLNKNNKHELHNTRFSCTKHQNKKTWVIFNYHSPSLS